MPSYNPFKQPKLTIGSPQAPAPPRLTNEADQRTEKWQAWQDQVFAVGSLPEYIVWDWLVNKKKQIPEIDFVYQRPFGGGKTIFGGLVVDFWIIKQNAVWNIQGLHFHYVTPKNRLADVISRVKLANRGLNVLFLYEDDLLTRPEYTLQRAWEGREVGGRKIF